MSENINLNENLNINENSSIISEKKENKVLKKEDMLKIQNNNFYTYFIDAMSSEKLDTDKIKALISLEQNINTIKEKYKYINISIILKYI
jgi:hypothetical protein